MFFLILRSKTFLLFSSHQPECSSDLQPVVLNPIHSPVQLVQFSHWVVSDSLQPQGLQHARPPCPSPTPGVKPNSCPLSRWCHPTKSPLIVVLNIPQAALSQMTHFFFNIDLCVINCFTDKNKVSPLLFTKHQEPTCEQVMQDKTNPYFLSSSRGSVYHRATAPHTRHIPVVHGQLFLPDYGQLIMDIHIFKFYHLYNIER